MKTVFSTLFVLFAFGAQADVSGSSSMELDLPMTVQELNVQINSTTAMAQNLKMTDSTLSYGLMGLSTAYEMDKAEMKQSMIIPSSTTQDLEQPVLTY